MKKRYTYKLRPGAHAEDSLIGESSRCRWVWNECVHIFSSRNYKGYARIDKMLTHARRTTPWLREGSSVAQQQKVRKFAQTANGFFAHRNGAPKFKKKKSDRVSLQYTTRGFSINSEGRLCLPNKVRIPVVWSRKLPSEPTSATVYQDSVGDWFVSFVVDVDDVERERDNNYTIGMDFGVKSTVVTTDDDFDLDFESHVDKHAKNFSKYQRRMALHRKNQKWDNYHKAKRDAAKEKRKEKRQRKERSRKWAQSVARNHSNVVVEDIKVSFMTKSRMSKKVYDASISTIKNELLEACGSYGCNVVMVNPKNTTQDCSRCGVRTKHAIGLNVRTYECWNCDLVIDRDRNAAFNMLLRAGFNPALDDDVRLSELYESFISSSTAI